MTGLHDCPRSACETAFTPHTETSLLVVGRIGGRPYAWPASSVERVLPMAAVTRVFGLPASIAGLLDLHGNTLPVVDPRPHLGLPSVGPRPEHHLLLLAASERYLLWVDRIETIVSVDTSSLERVQAEDTPASAPFITRIDGQLVTVLSPAVFDPGPVVQSARGR
jgi:chemotaxis signal transduction protein